MPSGLLQISSYGSNDMFLTGTPEITFFKIVYRRHTNFSVESIRVNFDDITGFGRDANLVVPKIGDLVHKMYLEVTIPTINIKRILPTSQYNPQLIIAKNNFKIMQDFMKVNIEGYRNGIIQINSINTTVQDVLEAIEDTFDIDNFATGTKTDLINILVGTKFLFEKISMEDIANSFKDNNDNIIIGTTKILIKRKLDAALILCKELNKYYHSEVVRLQNLVDDETNPIAKTAWVKKLGHVIMKSVTISIGGLEIDKQYSDWINIWYELSGNKLLDNIYNKMIGNVTELYNVDRLIKPSYTLYIPLQFWFCRHNGLALPLVALQYNEVSICVEFRKFSECFYYGELTESELANPIIRRQRIKQLQLPDLDDYVQNNNKDIYASLLIDYIYLDKNERRRFAQSAHEYLIEQIQLNEIDNVTQLQQNINLDFTHACKELIWVAQNINYVNVIDGYNELKWTNYDDKVNNNFINPIKYSAMDFVGKTRIPKLDSTYFNWVQPYQYHRSSPSLGINVYTFAIKPEEHQPSGSANLSRVPRVLLKLEMDQQLIDQKNSYNIRVYALSYNVLRIINGIGGLAFTTG